MSNAFEAYAKQANTYVTQPAKLIGSLKTRGEARLRYGDLVAGLNSCQTVQELEAYLAANRSVIRQFAAELEYYWTGDDDFRGLEKEIEWARARVDVGLDFPRWEPGYSQTGAEA